MIHSVEAQLDPKDPAAVGKRYQAGIPSGRYTTPEEIANAVLFLCSDLAANISGIQFVVDGARTAVGGAVTSIVQQ
jgi:NAD(P)-dependent dehydrogenase (short-subunit alcohol dehydrogenase family)